MNPFNATEQDYVARFGIQFADIINVLPHGHGAGWDAFECEIAGHRTTFRTNLTLGQFARQVFGTGGRLRRIEDGDFGPRYVVLIDRAPAAPTAASGFPSWVFHVA